LVPSGLKNTVNRRARGLLAAWLSTDGVGCQNRDAVQNPSASGPILDMVPVRFQEVIGQFDVVGRLGNHGMILV